MRFSKWHALGNTYLLVERAETGAPLTPSWRAPSATQAVSDGVLEVLSATDDEATVLIWNPDGSLAEMSGNGTRIAAAWLAQRTGRSDVQVHVGPRTVRAHIREDGLVEQELGEVEVGPPETLDVAGERLEVTPVSVGNPHAVVRLLARSRRPPPPRPSPRAPPALPRPHQRPARRGRGPAHPARLRVGAGRGGDVVVGLERGRRRRGRRRARLVREPGHGAPPGRRAPGRAPRPSGPAHRAGGRASSRSRTRVARRSGSS